MPKKTTVPGSLKNYFCDKCQKVIGFQFDVRLPRYRGNMVSLINGYYVNVDGVEYPQDQILFILNGKGPRTFAQLKDAVWEHWNYRDAATLLVLKDGGLEKGEHSVIATVSNFEQYGYMPGKDEKRVADGIELIDETFIDDYPFLSEEFEYDWKNTIARYNMKSVTMDIYLDVLQFRDHVMNYAEATERLKRDIIIASRLGFENVRCLISIPVPVIEAALPTAEKYNVRIGQEIHAPMPLVLKPDTPNRLHFHAPIDEVDRMIEMIERTGTKHAGFVPDMGLFQHGLTPIMYAQALRSGAPEEAVAFLKEKKGTLPNAELQTIMTEQFGAEIVAKMGRLIMTQGSAEPKELLKVCPYIVSIHGKFYEMVEDPTVPGGYYDPSTDYAEIFKYLQEGGFDGYINSELEGQGYCNDLPDAEMLDEREQVRRQHEMFKALGAV